MKRTILATVLGIQTKLVNNILSHKKEISRFMTAKTSEINVDNLYETILKEEDQLIVLKEAIQSANKGKHKDGKTNNFYIYKMSNLKSRKTFLTGIRDNKKNQWSNKQINERIKLIDNEIHKIDYKLTFFNSSKKIRVTINSELNLLLE